MRKFMHTIWKYGVNIRSNRDLSWKLNGLELVKASIFLLKEYKIFPL